MILLLAGTKDARELGAFLQKSGCEVLATAVSDYGGNLINNAGLDNFLVKRLSREEMAALIKEKEINAVIDATHPYAEIVSRQTIALSEELGIPYLRFERPETILPDSKLLYRVKNVDEAARCAVSLGKRIFLTTGSKNLQDFLAYRKDGIIFIARVLPDPVVLQKCFDLGLSPKEIVAMQGPFSYELNLALYRQYQAEVIVSKESGRVGGADEKIKTALELHIPLVLIERPKVIYPAVAGKPEDVIAWLKKER